MKNTLSTLFVFILINFYAQPPQGIPYQAVALNNSGNPIVNSNIGIKLSILDSSISGPNLYSENHIKTTNSQGFYNLNIGQGSPLFGVFTNINWSQNNKFLKVELDISGGTNYVLVGTTQLMSVPYALFSGTTGNINVSEKIKPINDMDALRLYIGKVGEVVYLKNYWSNSNLDPTHNSINGGGGHFSWVIKSTLIDDGGIIIKPTVNNPTNGIWKRIIDQPNYNIRWFGARGDNFNDDSFALNNLINYANTHGKIKKIVFPRGIYKLKNINLPSGFTLSGEQSVSHSFTNEAAVIIKPFTGSAYIFKFVQGVQEKAKNICIEYLTIDGDYQNVPTLESAIIMNGDAHRIYNNSINFCYKHAISGSILVSRIENNLIQGLYGLNNIVFNDYLGALHLINSGDNWILNNEIGVRNDYIIKKEKAVSFYANEFHNNFISNNIIENGGTGALISFAIHNKFSNNRYEFSGSNGLVLINNSLSSFVSESFQGNGWFENHKYSDLVIGKSGNTPQNQSSILTIINPIFLKSNNGANPQNIFPRYNISNFSGNQGDWKCKVLYPSILPGSALFKYELPSNGGTSFSIMPYVID